jgi:hypothetical protein
MAPLRNSLNIRHQAVFGPHVALADVLQSNLPRRQGASVCKAEIVHFLAGLSTPSDRAADLISVEDGIVFLGGWNLRES